MPSTKNQHPFWLHLLLLLEFAILHQVAGDDLEDFFAEEPSSNQPLKASSNPTTSSISVFRDNFSANGPLDYATWHIDRDCSVQTPKVGDSYASQSFFQKDGYAYISAKPCLINNEYDIDGSRAMQTVQTYDLWKGELEIRAKISRTATTSISLNSVSADLSLMILSEGIEASATFLGAKGPSKYHHISANFFDDFHVFKISWMNDEILWYFDEVVIHRIAIDPERRIRYEPAFMFLRISIHGFPPLIDESNAAGNYLQLDTVTLRKPVTANDDPAKGMSGLTLDAGRSGPPGAVATQYDSKMTFSRAGVDKPGSASEKPEQETPSAFVLLTTAAAITIILAAFATAFFARGYIRKRHSIPRQAPYNCPMVQHVPANNIYPSHLVPTSTIGGQSLAGLRQNIEIETTFSYNPEPVALSGQQLQAGQHAAALVARNDVMEACRQLEITSDFSKWDVATANLWLSWACGRYNISYEIVGGSILMYLDGAQLFAIANLYLHNVSSDGALESARTIWKWGHQLIMAETVADQAVPQSPTKPILWEFLRQKLDDPAANDTISWIEREKGLFKILNPDAVARSWGQVKNNPKMDYEKMSRSIRKYYNPRDMKEFGAFEPKIIKPLGSDHHTYQFSQSCLNAEI